jgi:hypothetical protein
LKTKITTETELKEILTEVLMNNTDRVSKISDHSVLSGLLYANAKIGKKALKDIALATSKLYPDDAYGTQLDEIASNHGISARFGASQSSVFLRIVADTGTTYLKNTHVFSGNHGLVFELDEDITIGVVGYTYAKVRSIDSGVKTKVDPLSINKVNPIPSGHKYVINEYAAFGGRDVEQDDVFRKRIKEGANILATGTLAQLEQIFIKINSNVLRVFYHGINSFGQPVIAICTQNGINLSSSELDEITLQAEQYLSLSDLRPFGTNTYGLKLINISWFPIDMDFRVDISTSFNPDDVRKDIQIRLNKYVDYRFWKANQKVEWDDLLQIVKTTRGVKYCPDTTFFPNKDIVIPRTQLPRLRGFIMRDLEGNIVVNIANTLNPTYFPNSPDLSLASTVISSI